MKIVIAGAGVAGASAADTLREQGFDGQIVMIGAETDPPYNRPNLSKERLRGEISDEQALLHPPDYYREKRIDLLLEQQIRHVNVIERLVELSGGLAISYDRLLIATGAHPRRLNAPGGDLEGVHYLRSLRDCAELCNVLQRRPRVLVAGTGFIGCEVAASARKLDCDVTIVGRSAPLEHALGKDLSEIYSRYHRDAGVVLHLQTFVERFEGDGRLERAVLFDGTTVPCDVAIVGIGVAPSFDIVRGEPLETGDGILVDELCRTSVPHVFAAGDVACAWNPRYAARLRIEHFDNARRQAAAAAKTMLGATEAYNPIPSFWSEQYSYGMQYRGYTRAWDSVVFRGAPADGSFSAFYLSNGVLQAVCSVNRYKENSTARGLIGKAVDPVALAHDGTELQPLSQRVG